MYSIEPPLTASINAFTVWKRKGREHTMRDYEERMKDYEARVTDGWEKLNGRQKYYGLKADEMMQEVLKIYDKSNRGKEIHVKTIADSLINTYQAGISMGYRMAENDRKRRKTNQ